MKCYGFSYGGEDLSVELCQEIIEYHTVRAEGIPVTGNIVVKSLSEKPKYLGIWHRADLGEFDIAGTRDWLNSKNFYTHIFFNLVEDRGEIMANESTIAARLFDEADFRNPRLQEEKTKGIVVPSVPGENCLEVSHPVKDSLAKENVKQPDSEFVPYTYAKIGPFAGRNKYYAIRVSTRITGGAFTRLVAENPLLGTRYYKVYGVSEILEHIEDIDLPHLKRHSDEVTYKMYESYFETGLKNNRLVPKFYSIVAIDSPESNKYRPQRVYSVHVKRALKDLTDIISPDLFKHDRLENLKGRVFWFINRDRSQEFLLWLEGPMAEMHEPEPLMHDV